MVDSLGSLTSSWSESWSSSHRNFQTYRLDGKLERFVHSSPLVLDSLGQNESLDQSEQNDSVASWDGNFSEIRQLTCQLPLAEQDKIFSGPEFTTEEVIDSCVMAVNGIESEGFLWNPRAMRFETTTTRLPGLSIVCTSELAGQCARIGSYTRRLSYTIAQIRQLRGKTVLVALAAAIEKELAEIHQLMDVNRDGLSPLKLLQHIRLPAILTHGLASLVGCDQLDRPAHLVELPSVVDLLDRAWSLADGNRSMSSQDIMLWRVVGASVSPWLGQLSTCIGLVKCSGSSFYCDSDFKAAYFPDLFIEPDDSSVWYVPEYSKVPVFVPESVATMAASAVNCLVCATRLDWTDIYSKISACPAQWPGYSSFTGHSQRQFVHTDNESPFALSRLDMLDQLDLDSTDNSKLEAASEVKAPYIGEVLEEMTRITSHCQLVNRLLLQRLRPYIMLHSYVLCDIFMFADGVLFSYTNFESQTSTLSVSAIQQALSRYNITPDIASVNESTGTLSYDPPRFLVSAQLIQSAKQIGMALVKLQSAVRQTSVDSDSDHRQLITAMAELERLSTAVQQSIETHREQLRDASTIESLLQCFEPLLNLPVKIGLGLTL